jgi:hypothetical protein
MGGPGGFGLIPPGPLLGFRGYLLTKLLYKSGFWPPGPPSLAFDPTNLYATYAEVSLDIRIKESRMLFDTVCVKLYPLKLSHKIPGLHRPRLVEFDNRNELAVFLFPRTQTDKWQPHKIRGNKKRKCDLNELLLTATTTIFSSPHEKSDFNEPVEHCRVLREIIIV